MKASVEGRIRERAYAIWIEEGCPEGCDGDHWYRAVREIEALTQPVPETIAVAEKPVAARKPRAAKAAATEPARKPRARKKADQTA